MVLYLDFTIARRRTSYPPQTPLVGFHWVCCKAAEQSAAEVALMRLGTAESMQNHSQPALMSDSGVSSCLFKSRLQEFTQKVGLPNPVYETIKEGPPHEPTFASTVIVDNVRYSSLPGFYNRKAAEQSAADVALMRLGNAESMQNLSQPVHETGLCKNLLQDYSHKMNLAMPRYECQSFETENKLIRFSCTVDVGGRKYVGAADRTKKKAEINAARTALLAIQSSGLGPNNSGYTVVPMKKVTDLASSNQETVAALKPKKFKLKKKQKRKVSDASNQVHAMHIRG